MDQEARKLEVEELEARQAYVVAAKSEDAADMEAAERRYDDALRKRLDFLSKEEQPAPIELRNQISCARYIQRFASGLDLDGAEAEFNQELGLPDYTDEGHRILPLEALLTPGDGGNGIEDRATAITSGLGAIEEMAAEPISARVFKPLITGRLGVAMPSVMYGEQVYTHVTAGTTADVVAESGTHDGTPLTLRSESVNPFRLTAEYIYTRETQARLGPQFEPLLRNDLRMVMGDKLDNEVLNGDGATPTRPKGILGRINTAAIANGETGSTADDSAFTYHDYRKSVFQWIDGRISNDISMVRILLGLASWKHAMGIINSNSVPQYNGIEGMTMQGAMVLMTDRMPAASAATSSAGSLQNALWTTEPMNVIVPIWNGLEMIVDPYTGASKGEVKLVMVMLFGIAYKNSSANEIRGWKKTQYVIANKT